MSALENKLCYGDCLDLMRDMPAASVDLIYLDPPFNSNRTYNAIYKDNTGRPLPAQIEAFCDTWILDGQTERIVRGMPLLMRQHGLDADTAEAWSFWTKALRKTDSSLLAYIAYMTERLLMMKVVLKPTGSIYLHCDSTASHYIKIMMDAIFGHANFRREIIWSNEDQSGFKSQARNWIRGNDILLYYVMSDKKFVFNKEYRPRTERTVKRYDKVDEEGRRYKIYHEADGSERRVYLKEEVGVSMPSVWTDIPSFQTVNNTGEYLGYETQKPLALLERVIKASSNEGDVVFDPFCGCATTIEAAHRLKRKWIGMDIAIHAIKRVANVRLRERLGLVEGKDFEITGIPNSHEGARDLWERDPYHFQKWAVEQIDGFVSNKRTADGGIDGRLYFAVPDCDILQSMVIEVKGGQNIAPSVVQALRGVLEENNAAMAGLIVLHPLGERKAANFRSIMAEAGELEVLGVNYAKMQMLTVDEILQGKRFHTPTVVGRGVNEPVLPMG